MDKLSPQFIQVLICLVLIVPYVFVVFAAVWTHVVGRTRHEASDAILAGMRAANDQALTMAIGIHENAHQSMDALIAVVRRQTDICEGLGNLAAARDQSGALERVSQQLMGVVAAGQAYTPAGGPNDNHRPYPTRAARPLEDAEVSPMENPQDMGRGVSTE